MGQYDFTKTRKDYTMSNFTKILKLGNKLIAYKNQNLTAPKKPSPLTIKMTVSGKQGAGKTTLINLINILLDQLELFMPFPVKIDIDIQEVQE
jgi:pantothenate kinase-related protein Tda10